MVKKKMKKIKQKLLGLAKDLAKCGPATRGSIVLIGVKTKQYYLSVNIKGKTRLIFLGKKRVEQAREYMRNYKKILDIVEKMTNIIIERLRKADPE
jgi:hypothetical protein